MELTRPVGSLLRLIYPPRCLLCNRPGFDNMDLCISCYRSLPWNKTACISCALPLPDDITGPVKCGHCLQKAPLYEAAFSLFRYEHTVVKLIQGFKFNEKLSHGRLLSQLLVAAFSLPEPVPQCLIPIPLHNKRIRQRGFNQSIELARPLAKKLGVPLVLDVVKRIRATEQQTGLDAVARRKNIRGAFEVVQTLEWDHVAIVDDVVTTGSTVNELARILKKAGVKRVDVISVARAEKSRF